jgi:ankyrin repeat protein
MEIAAHHFHPDCIGEGDTNNHGLSSIIAASSKGHVNVVELLLSKGADINDKGNNAVDV